MSVISPEIEYINNYCINSGWPQKLSFKGCKTEKTNNRNPSHKSEKNPHKGNADEVDTFYFKLMAVTKRSFQYFFCASVHFQFFYYRIFPSFFFLVHFYFLCLLPYQLAYFLLPFRHGDCGRKR